MLKEPESVPNFPRAGSTLGLFVSASAYAFILNTEQGRKWEAEHTWFTVLVGVLMTLGWLAADDRKSAERSLGAFIISGLPIIFRALLNQTRMIDRVVDHTTGLGGGA